MDEQEAIHERQLGQMEQQQAGTAAQAAASAATRKLEKRKENPEFFAQLRDLGVDTHEYDWVSARLGPLGAGAHLIGNRGPQYEREAKWLDANSGERIISEREPGRLCRGRLLTIAQRVHLREDKETVKPNTPDERRVVRDSMEAVTNFKTLGIEATGLSKLTDATTVSKREESSEESRKERAANLIG
jgi:hypothetical protein